MLEQYPFLRSVIEILDSLLKEKHPSWYGPEATHPFRTLKPYKVMHDHLWGTERFSWLELCLIDSPLLQRLRRIHQTGLASYVYPSAQHSRFEHTLGVMTVASKVYDSIIRNSPREVSQVVKSVYPGTNESEILRSLRQEVRLAAILHDVGHSLHSHASERVYSEIPLLANAASELSNLAGRKKGEGEVLSFCFTLTEAVADLLARSRHKLSSDSGEEYVGDIDLNNVALMIIGRTKHPHTQFLGDIISSGLDADKLDYLLRDAGAAGLPIKYDLERYLYTVHIVTDAIADGEEMLKQLYETVGTSPERREADQHIETPYYEAYRLGLPRRSMSTIEQIIICKIMLFSYIYHHPKVVAAEGLLVRLLRMQVTKWRAEGFDDAALLKHFMTLTDSALDSDDFLNSSPHIASYSYRVQYRLLPRVLLTLRSAEDDDGQLIRKFIEQLQDRQLKRKLIETLEENIGQCLLQEDASLGSSPTEALEATGIWVEVPKPPSIENVNAVLGRGKDAVEVGKLFPIEKWIEAYQAYRYFIRIYAFSEYEEIAYKASVQGLMQVTGVSSANFFKTLKREAPAA